MGRVSTKENKNIYFQKREELGLSREKASELLKTIPPERIEKIENQHYFSLVRMMQECQIISALLFYSVNMEIPARS